MEEVDKSDDTVEEVEDEKEKGTEDKPRPKRMESETTSYDWSTDSESLRLVKH